MKSMVLPSQAYEVKLGHRHLSLPVKEKARFMTGETMPQLLLYRSRAIPLLDDLFGMRLVPTDVTWKLASYVDQA
jgi:hypothetical protein